MTTTHTPPGAPVRDALNKITNLEIQELYGSLTPREHEVMAKLVAGKGDKEIANDLHISLKTVRRHIENVRRKLRLASRSGAAAAFVVHALLEHCDSCTREAIARSIGHGPPPAKPSKTPGNLHLLTPRQRERERPLTIRYSERCSVLN